MERSDFLFTILSLKHVAEGSLPLVSDTLWISGD